MSSAAWAQSPPVEPMWHAYAPVDATPAPDANSVDLNDLLNHSTRGPLSRKSLRAAGAPAAPSAGETPRKDEARSNAAQKRLPARLSWSAARTVSALRRAAAPLDRMRRYVAKEVLVILPSTLPPQAVDDMARRHRLTQLDSGGVGLTGTTFYRWRIWDGRSVADVIRALEAEGGTGIAQPNYRYDLQ